MKIVSKWKTEEKLAVYLEKWVLFVYSVAVALVAHRREINTWIQICCLTRIYLFYEFDVLSWVSTLPGCGVNMFVVCECRKYEKEVQVVEGAKQERKSKRKSAPHQPLFTSSAEETVGKKNQWHVECSKTRFFVLIVKPSTFYSRAFC